MRGGCRAVSAACSSASRPSIFPFTRACRESSARLASSPRCSHRDARREWIRSSASERDCLGQLIHIWDRRRHHGKGIGNSVVDYRKPAHLERLHFDVSISSPASGGRHLTLGCGPSADRTSALTPREAWATVRTALPLTDAEVRQIAGTCRPISVSGRRHAACDDRAACPVGRPSIRRTRSRMPARMS